MTEDHVLVGRDEVDPVVELVGGRDESVVEGVDLVREVRRVVAVSQEEQDSDDDRDSDGWHDDLLPTVPGRRGLPLVGGDSPTIMDPDGCDLNHVGGASRSYGDVVTQVST